MNPLRAARRAAMLLAAVTFVLASTGCADGPDDTEGGMGLPVVGWLPEPVDGDTAISGTMLVAENGCFHLETEQGNVFVVWPDGFQHDGARVRAENGSPIAEGDDVSGTGVVLSSEAATEAGGGPDSQLAQAVQYCADGADVAVLSSVTVP